MENVYQFTDTLIKEIGIERTIEKICRMNEKELKSLVHYGE